MSIRHEMLRPRHKSVSLTAGGRCLSVSQLVSCSGRRGAGSAVPSSRQMILLRRDAQVECATAAVDGSVCR